VVAGEHGLFEDRRAGGVETAEKKGALHLCARDGHGVFDALQVFAFDERCDRDRWVELVGFGAGGACNVGAPRAQRLDDAAHRAACERRVSDHAGPKALAAQQAGKQSHRGARVAAIDNIARHPQAA